MSGRYIDFVPMNAKRPAKKKPAEKMPVTQFPASVETESRVEMVHETTIVAQDMMGTGSDSFSLKNEPEYGVIEDLRPKFVKTEVPKRPLSQRHDANSETNISDLKAEKIVTRKIMRVVEKPVENSDSIGVEAQDQQAKMKIPKSPFINHAKVTKRPLSKNIYEKKIEPTKEEKTGPITIIAKPEKDTKAGLVITIILTIILGAAAGTIAFLLLPK